MENIELIDKEPAEEVQVFRAGIYRDLGVEAQIKNLESPAGSGAWAALEARIHASSIGAYRQAVQAFADKKHDAQVRLAVARNRANAAANALKEELSHVIHVSPTALARGISCLVALFSCIGAEYIVSLDIIGWLLNQEGTLVVQALALVSVAALTGVEFGLGIVLTPYLQDEKKSLNDSKVRQGFVYAFAVVAVVGNFWMVWTLADAREIAIRMRNETSNSTTLVLDDSAEHPKPSADSEINVDAVISQFIRSLALAACFDGAMFSLIAAIDFTSLRARKRHIIRLAELEKSDATVQEELARAEQAVVRSTEEYARADETAAQDKEEWIAAMMTLLQLRQDFLIRREEEQKVLQSVLAENERAEARQKLKSESLVALTRKVLRSKLDRTAFAVVS